MVYLCLIMSHLVCVGSCHWQLQHQIFVRVATGVGNCKRRYRYLPGDGVLTLEYYQFSDCVNH